jgi:chromosome segregation ATPase
MAQDSSNKQEAKELMRLIDNLKNSSSRTDPELSQLEIKRAELEKELESMKVAIDRRKFTLAQIPDAVKQKKQELLAKVKRSGVIRSSLENTPGTAEEYEQKIAEVDVVRLELLKIIQDVLDL